ncbi:MAG: hypothetical protein KKB51_01925 [Candidatus Riflebacteria bacterium]|nr:hypothetical protein [Candidatus Riflebacteria bacterium]
MNDTSMAVEIRYREMLMRLSPLQRFHMASGMFTDAKILVEESIRQQMGQITDAELKTELFKRFYACDFSETELAAITAHLKFHSS